jgi:alkylhydroperoxidase family enzyme
MLLWNPDGADDHVWAALREHFSDEEILELGYFVSVAFGGQCVLRTLAVRHGEYMATTSGGLAPGAIAP